MFDDYRNRMSIYGTYVGEALRKQSTMIIEDTWTRDPNYRQVYVLKVDSGLPTLSENLTLIDAKFNIKTYQSITADEVSYMLQFRHGAEKQYPEIDVGSYVCIQDEDGMWKWWLICHLDERPSFRQYQILECNWTCSWVVDGIIYRCLGIKRVQQSYNSGSWYGDRFTFLDNITSAWLPTNKDTLTIAYDQRFIISDPRRYPPLIWQVSKIEDTQPEGLTKLKFTQERYSSAIDNSELMLANYYDSNITPIIPDTQNKVSSITYTGTKPTLKVGGSYKTFTANFEDENVTVSHWIIKDEKDNIIVYGEDYIIRYDEDKLKLKVAQQYDLIGKVLTVQAIGSDKSVAETKMEVVG